ncbi:MAG: YitT family protein [Candidatus Pseudoruminococcus sp.]|uniref:YitT family protein n=1 Tax=Candidatus Pseudoruminococcus sp. TaxID=3101048 RepID=UPI002A7B77B6|nr:YitT family protein [Ruminococcus sp.]MDY2782451.1 YitT family protein [Candidatus Pseudoruminococcus sp.]
MAKLRRIKLRNMIMLTIAGIVNAIGITIFLSPVKLYDSGISGTSMLLAQITPDYLTLSMFLLILNIPLFIYGLKKQGALFTFYAIYTVAVYSICSWLITDILPVDVTFASPLAGTDLLLCALFGGVISGIGSGLAIRYGGAMDGVEVLSVIFAKKIGISVGSFVMIYNILLYIVCGFVVNSWILPLYSIVTYFAALKTIDYIVEGIDRAKAAMIVTTMPDEICKALSEEFETGITTLNAKGWYSQNDKTMIYFIVNRFQIGKMKEIIHEIDAKAYISIYEVADVLSGDRE